jgi:type IV pilus assembly protein PilM
MAVSLPARRAAEWFDGFARSGLSLRRLDVSPCALVRLALGNTRATGAATPAQTWTPAPNDLWAVCECGFRQTVLTVVVGSRPAYVRCLPVATDSWTRRLADAFDIPYAEAEELKRIHGICPDAMDGASSDRGLDEIDAGDLPAVIFSVLRESLDALVREIDLCCSYVMRSYGDLNVSRLVLAGGGANLRGLAEYLALHVGVPVARVAGLPGEAGELGRAGPNAAAAMPQCEAAAVIGGALLDLEAA